MNGREQFEANYEERKLALLSSVKEAHWQTWMAAQEAILSAHGPAIEMRVLREPEFCTKNCKILCQNSKHGVCDGAPQ
jgi:hypothetical protein